MHTLENQLLNAVKFINFKKIGNAGFIVQKNQAVFYSGNFIMKFQVNNSQIETRHFIFDMLSPGTIYESIDDKNTSRLLIAIDKYFTLDCQNKLNLPENEFFDFLEAIFKNNNQVVKYNNNTKIKIESNFLKIENTFAQDSSNNLKELSFEYEINNQINIDLIIYNSFKLFLKFMKQKKQDFNFFAKTEEGQNLFLAKNNNFEVLALC